MFNFLFHEKKFKKYFKIYLKICFYETNFEPNIFIIIGVLNIKYFYHPNIKIYIYLFSIVQINDTIFLYIQEIIKTSSFPIIDKAMATVQSKGITQIHSMRRNNLLLFINFQFGILKA